MKILRCKRCKHIIGASDFSWKEWEPGVNAKLRLCADCWWDYLAERVRGGKTAANASGKPTDRAPSQEENCDKN